MKLINTTIGKNPPVVRMNSFVQRVVCYTLEKTQCDDWVEGTDEVNFYPNIPNEVSANTRSYKVEYLLNNESNTKKIGAYQPFIPNRASPDRNNKYEQRDIQYKTPINDARFKLYSDEHTIMEDYVPIYKDKFKILLPKLPQGYYYLDVWAKGGFNRVMLNVSD